MRSHFLKRLLDLTLTFTMLIILGPICVVLAILVYMKLGFPVLFRQMRPGIDGRSFILYKFRTMTHERDEKGNILKDEERFTTFSQWLRRYSLDELPELTNILRGDMSFVGPRPLLVEYLKRYTPEQARRHEIKPGITGWAQVNGRNAITWEEKFKYDVWYVDNWSLWLDIKIIFMTIIKVIRSEGINQPGQATMEEFKGNAHKL